MSAVKIFYLFLFVGLIYVGYLLSALFQVHHYKFIALDVGQGDALLIQTPSQHNILIDGGPDNNVVYRLSDHLPIYNRVIDLMVLTHPDGDHLIGLNEVLARYDVRNILFTNIEDSRPAYLHFKKEILDSDVSVYITGEVNHLHMKDLKIDILHPDNLTANGLKPNDSSVVLRLSYQDSSVLATGDITKRIEQKLSNQDIKSDILKVAHHGSKTSSDEGFIRAVNPDLAIISVGENRYGHPSLSVMSRFDRIGIPVLTTQVIGDIVLVYQENQWYLE